MVKMAFGAKIWTAWLFCHHIVVAPPQVNAALLAPGEGMELAVPGDTWILTKNPCCFVF